MSKVVLVTGATGFVGRQIVKSLADRGLRIYAVVRPGSAARLEGIQGVELILVDDVFAASAGWWAAICSTVDTVIHAAWYTEPSSYMTSVKNLDCLRGSLELAAGCIQARLRRFVGIGTCAEYAIGTAPLDVDTPLEPTTPYAGAKAATYFALKDLLPRLGTEFAWCRLFYLHGEGENPRRLVPYLRERLASGKPADLASGTHVRDYLEVREAAAKIAQIALSGACGPVNVCSGRPQTVRELAESIADEYGRRDLLNFGARPDNDFDPPYVVGVPGGIC